MAQSKKAKARSNDSNLKGKAKEREQKAAELAAAAVAAEQAEHDNEDDEMEDAEEEQEETAPLASTSNYLDPSLFASAAQAYTLEEEKNAPAPPGMGKHKLKRMIRAQKQARAMIALERANQIGEGGTRQIGSASCVARC